MINPEYQGESLSETGTPFRGILKKHSEFEGRTTKLKELEDNPEKVIREVGLDLIARGNPRLKNPIEIARFGKKLIGEFGQYHIRTPGLQFIVGEGENGPGLYTVANKVEGINLGKLGVFGAEEMAQAHRELDQLYDSLTRYLCDKYQSKEPYLWDAMPEHQYMWGKVKGDQENHIYLVDVDPQYYTYAESGIGHFVRETRELIDTIIKREEILGVRFKRARENIRKFLALIHKKDQYRFDEIKKIAKVRLND